MENVSGMVKGKMSRNRPEALRSITTEITIR